MKTHETKKVNSNVVIMWSDPKIKGEQTIKLNVRDEKINEGDRISCGSSDNPIYYYIIEINENKPSSLSGWDYVTATAIRTTKP
jgi:hypothetical protein